jgi:hypothetical protein
MESGWPSLGLASAGAHILEALMLNAVRMGCPDTNLPYVDVRDVATAHVMAVVLSTSCIWVPRQELDR